MSDATGQARSAAGRSTADGSGNAAAGCTASPDLAPALSVPEAERLATLLKAVSDPLRLRFLSAIAGAPGGERCVCDLAALAPVSQPTVSHHLRVLRDAGVLVSERRGTWVHYRISDAHEAAVATLLRTLIPGAPAES